MPFCLPRSTYMIFLSHYQFITWSWWWRCRWTWDWPSPSTWTWTTWWSCWWWTSWGWRSPCTAGCRSPRACPRRRRTWRRGGSVSSRCRKRRSDSFPDLGSKKSRRTSGSWRRSWTWSWRGWATCREKVLIKTFVILVNLNKRHLFSFLDQRNPLKWIRLKWHSAVL